ncbi:beta and beta-prime subunits of DNA dependent RNA-polymerase [Mycena maculata]|uniref:DNA-directed RNA polymerase subunit n=1 Tax=Mycena maculata TaxID=230809 RepID=A0AAD7J6T1_9AGAR|nr:beta and beta-prime subunits of DNA dependent RNA-polymerase [Mycena maculata]
MSGHRFAHSAAPIHQVKEVQFSILSPEEIKEHSVARIEYLDTTDELTRRPRIGGLMDPRMGTTNPDVECQTCGEGMSGCPGHFGHIELARPVFHPGFISKVKKILECICINCGKLKADLSDRIFADKIRYIRQPKKRMAIVWAHCMAIPICEADPPRAPDGRGHGGCGSAQPRIRKEGLKLYAENKNPIKELNPPRYLLSPSDIYRTLEKISESDLQLLGLSHRFARPEWMLLSVIPVPPSSMRPRTIDVLVSKQDDLTFKLGEIIKASAHVQTCIEQGMPADVVTQFEELVQFHVATYLDNNITQTLHPSGDPIQSIRSRLTGREGRVRAEVTAKRVDFCARTVITGDPNLELDEVGVPWSIAMHLTYPERVTSHNIEYLQTLIRNGPMRYPGARYVVTAAGERIDLGGALDMHTKSLLEQQDDPYGCIVERHLTDGDFVLLVQQPSLHRTSTMSHRVNVMPYSTFRLNPSIVAAYGTKFDGGEMTMHVPQSEETRAELSQIAWVPRQIVSPQANKPIMSIVQDTLFGIHKFTLRDTFLDWNQVQNILLWVPDWDGAVPVPAIVKPKPLWTGKQILSLVLPRGINFARNPFSRDHQSNPVFDDGMLIEDGKVLFGVVDKTAVGAALGSLIDVVFREEGPEVTRRLFGGLQTVVNFWLFHSGFSVGVGDTLLHRDTSSFIAHKIEDSRADVSRLMKDAICHPYAGMTIRETFESTVESHLDYARDSYGAYAQRKMKKENNFKQMVVAGPMGSSINITQMTVCLGQQRVEGHRIPCGFRHRTLPHFTKDDFSPEARGFIRSPYRGRLTPTEFFFHAMAGRESLVDDGRRNIETGRIQRRLVRVLEDIMVCYDGTVRNSRGELIQLIYGEDGLDGARVEKQNIDTLALGDQELRDNYCIDAKNGRAGFTEAALQDHGSVDPEAELDEEYRRLSRDRNLLQTFTFPRMYPTTNFYLPVNLRRIVQSAVQVFRNPRPPRDLDPAYIIHAVKDLGKRLVIVRGDDPASKEAQQNALLRFQIHLRTFFSTRQVLERHRLDREAFDWALGEVEKKFNQAIVNPGEMCGILAAQSIARAAAEIKPIISPRPGVSMRKDTLGVPRLQEIINVAENIATPSLSIFLEPDISIDSSRVRLVAGEIKYKSVRTITSAVEIWYDPNVRSTLIQEDTGFVEDFFAIPDEEFESTLHLQSPWLIRMELRREEMVGKLTMHYVARRIAESFPTDLSILWSEDNADKLIIRCRVLHGADQGEVGMGLLEEDVFLHQLANSVLDTSLGGIKDIRKVLFLQCDKVVLQSDNSLEICKKEEWVLETNGTDLKIVIGVDGVDSTRTYSNSCVEILHVLGIEAARAVMLRELRAVIEYDGSYINYRHLALLCDLMTHRGTLTGIDQLGNNRADAGALRKCSVEDTVEIFLEAAAVAEKDYCLGAVENVMLGQVAAIGTGAFKVVDMPNNSMVNAEL